MKRALFTIGSSALLLIPVISQAQITTSSNAGPFQNLLLNILVFTNNVLIPFIIGIGFLVFVWGMFMYFVVGGADDEKRKSGRGLMIYATLGFVFIIIFWGIVNFVVDSIGLEGQNLQDIPRVPTSRS